MLSQLDPAAGDVGLQLGLTLFLAAIPILVCTPICFPLGGTSYLVVSISEPIQDLSLGN